MDAWIRHAVARGLLAAALAALSACQQLAMLPPVDIALPTAALPAPAAAADGVGLATAGAASNGAAPASARRPNGAIFQAERYRPLFENHRARLVGDILTVNITEKVSAAQTNTSTLDRGGKVNAGISALPFLKSSALTRAAANSTSSNTFTGKGTTQASNDFSGVITATVVQVLGNGHLIVAGEKQIGVDANVHVLRFSGQVDPQAIAPGNQVASTAIANVRIEQRGRGQQIEAQSTGWLQRFFLNVSPI